MAVIEWPLYTSDIMVIVMNLQSGTRWIAPLLISTLLPAGVCAATLAEVKSVYLFPMSNGFDQYLADRLTRDHIFQVVTDPKMADAVITDKLGLGFQAELLKARPDLAPPPPKKESSDKDKDTNKKEVKEDEFTPPTNSFHATQGTVFIVQAKTQQVVWSTFQRPASHTPKDMERTAGKVAMLLQKELAPPATKK
jgi:hypothetical protein